MILTRLLPGFGFSLLRPVGEHLMAKLPDLLDGACFGFISGAALGDGLVDHVGDTHQPLPEKGAGGKETIETLLGSALRILLGFWPFVFHERDKYTQSLKVQDIICRI